MRLAYAKTFPPGGPPAFSSLDGVDGLVLSGDPGLPVDSRAMQALAIEAIGALGPAYFLSAGLTAIASLGGNFTRAGATPEVAARVGERLAESGCGNLAVSAVVGDSVLPDLETLWRSGAAMPHADTGQPLAELNRPIVSAAADLGDQPLASALSAGARLVIVGAAADATLVAGLLRASREFAAGELAPLANQAATRLAAGDGPLEVTNREPSAAALPATPTDHCRVSVRYVNQLLVSTVIQSAELGQDTESSRAELVDFVQSLGVSTADARVQLTGQSNPSAATLAIRAADQPAADALVRSLLVRLRPSAGGPWSYDPAFPPHTHRQLATWPTAVPAALLEWSVITHTAAGWRDRGA